MANLREAIEDANPNWNEPPKRGLFERLMLGRINENAFRLPESFSERTLGGLVFAYGDIDEHAATIHVHQEFPEKKHKPTHFMKIGLQRDVEDGSLLELEAERVVMDSEKMQLSLFSLDSQEGKLSLFRVMRGVDLAVRTVESAAALRQHVTHPEAGFSQF